MKKIILSIFIAAAIFVVPAFALSESTQQCVDRVYGHVLSGFPNFDPTDTEIKTGITSKIERFCLTTPVSSVNGLEYSEITRLGQLEWDYLEKFAADALFKQVLIDTIMNQNHYSVIESIKTIIPEYSKELLQVKNTYQGDMAHDDYITDSSSFVYKTSKLIDQQYANFITYSNGVLDNISKNYTCNTDGMCVLTSSIPTVTMQQTSEVITQPVSLRFKDVNIMSIFYEAIKYMRDNNIVEGYADGTYKPLNTINRAEFTKIIVGTIEPSPIGSDCFPDVSKEWFSPYVCYAKNNHIIDGYKDGTFKPDQNINLAEALKIVLLAMNISLSSETGSSWYDVYINTAQEQNFLLNINTDVTHFFTRGEMAQLIYNIKK